MSNTELKTFYFFLLDSDMLLQYEKMTGNWEKDKKEFKEMVKSGEIIKF